MNRLREETGTDPIRARGVKLLLSTNPRENAPELKRRVWAGLVENRRSIQQTTAIRTGFARRRPFALAGILLLSAATAGAMIGRRGLDQSAAEPKKGVESRIGSAQGAGKRVGHNQVALASTPTVAPASTDSAISTGIHPVVRVPARTKDRPVWRKAPVAAMPERTAQGGHQVLLDAMVALRRDHDFERAGGLLERFLVDYPRGALREEAMVLAIEAASGRSDRGTRDRWARTYLQSYPSGRFRDFVEGSLVAQ